MDEPSSSTPPTEGPRVHEPRREKFKAFGKNWLIGTVILALFSIVGELANSSGVQEINIRTISSPADLVYIWAHLNPATGFLVFFAAAGVGAVTFLIVSSEGAFGKLWRLHKDAEIPDAMLNDEIRKDLKKFRIIPLAVWMFLVGLIVTPVVGGVYVVSGLDVSNAHGLLNAYLGGHIFTIISVVIGGAVVGYLTRHLKNQYENIYNKIEPYVKRTRVL